MERGLGKEQASVKAMRNRGRGGWTVRDIRIGV